MKLFFDKQDYELREKVNELVQREKQPKSLQRLANPNLHPHGIKEMAAKSDVRIANAAIALLDSIEAGKASERISALRTLHDEVLHSAHTGFQRNTARVLLAIIKDLVRSRGLPNKQLKLAHDFHKAASGKPRVIRSMLKRYHLLEMPEEWNQMAFDDHVHDANTKGRKSPTHLVMDAWIKGIRYLTVVYYNHVKSEVASELLEAAEIMGVFVRIGIELPAKFREKYVRLIWVPRGFLSQRDFLEFLSESPMRTFMEEGRKISDYRQKYVINVLEHFNQKHRDHLARYYECDVDPLDASEFLSFVNAGQPSLLHLAEFLHKKLMKRFSQRIETLRKEFNEADESRKQAIVALVDRMNRLDSVTLWELYLRPSANPELPDPNVPQTGADIPVELQRTPKELIQRFHSLPTGYRLTLNLSDLSTEDVVELLYEGTGKITHLEIFNLKDYINNKTQYCKEIDALRHMINAGNVIALKRFIRKLMERLEQTGDPEARDRIGKLKDIQANVGVLINWYQGTPLSTRIGSDSAGRSKNIHGMGLALMETLPYKAQTEIRHSINKSREIIPVHMSARFRITYFAPTNASFRNNWLLKTIRRFTWLKGFGLEHANEWAVVNALARFSDAGNLTTLGGLHDEPGSQFSLIQADTAPTMQKVGMNYLRTPIKNTLKILIGLVPAFLTFFLTRDWWLLAYFGAFIWFGITSVRNIFQSVLGGGGFRRSPLLRWNDHISWNRISDSLMYTGFSVPLLDYFVKTVLLDRSFNITTSTSPVLLYTCIAIANGLYIATHNAFRGLPRGAIFGNLFRTVISIPVAIAMNTIFGTILVTAGVPGVLAILQNWAAIISKFSSDIVAAFIEGTADRFVNLEQRLRDYKDKIQQVLNCHSRLELLYPNKDVLGMLSKPKELVQNVKTDAEELERTLIINALDLLYIYMFQPRALTGLKLCLRRISLDERQIFLQAQLILERKKEISQFFVDGLVGKYFSKALAFYLERVDDYLRDLDKIASRICGVNSR